MCRMFGYVGNSRDDIVRLALALRRAAERDPLAPGKSGMQHKDGWGYVVYSDLSATPSYYRSPNAIFQDEVQVPEISGTAYAIFHARASTSVLTGDAKYSHPFRVGSEDASVFLAHNGSLKKELNANLIPPLDEPEKSVDSELGLKYVLQQQRNGLDLGAATGKLERFVWPNSALNLLVLDVPSKNKPRLSVKHYYNRNPDKDDRTRFYQIHHQSLRGGTAAFSSTLTLVDQGLGNAPLLETDELTPFAELS
jgi:predicted glutamine amidotransferase